MRENIGQPDSPARSSMESLTVWDQGEKEKPDPGSSPPETEKQWVEVRPADRSASHRLFLFLSKNLFI